MSSVWQICVDILKGMKNLGSERHIILDFNFLQQLSYQVWSEFAAYQCSLWQLIFRLILEYIQLTIIIQ